MKCGILCRLYHLLRNLIDGSRKLFNRACLLRSALLDEATAVLQDETLDESVKSTNQDMIIVVTLLVASIILAFFISIKVTASIVRPISGSRMY